MYTPSEADQAKIDKNFVYHPPKPDQIPRYEEIRSRAKEFAQFLVETCPSSRELSLALTHLQECVMLSNASIACNE